MTAFDPEAGHALVIAADLLPSPSRRLKIVDSGRGLRRASRGKTALVFDDRTNQLWLNSNGRGSGWGAEGGLLAVFDVDVYLSKSDIQIQAL